VAGWRGAGPATIRRRSYLVPDGVEVVQQAGGGRLRRRTRGSEPLNVAGRTYADHRECHGAILEDSQGRGGITAGCGQPVKRAQRAAARERDQAGREVDADLGAEQVALDSLQSVLQAPEEMQAALAAGRADGLPDDRGAFQDRRGAAQHHCCVGAEGRRGPERPRQALVALPDQR
jgi:hypothetical protein